MCQFAGAMFKFNERKSKFTVKVTCLKCIAPLEKSGHKEHKYERPISYSKTVMANIQSRSKVLQGYMFKTYGTIGKALS